MKQNHVCKQARLLALVACFCALLVPGVRADWQNFNTEFFTSIGEQDFSSPNSPFPDLVYGADGTWYFTPGGSQSGNSQLTGQSALNAAYAADHGFSAVTQFGVQAGFSNPDPNAPAPATITYNPSVDLAAVTGTTNSGLLAVCAIFGGVIAIGWLLHFARAR